MRLKLGNAFYIVWADAILLTIAMFPLLVSSLTSIIGFSESTIIGALLGAIITRPTYGGDNSKEVWRLIPRHKPLRCCFIQAGFAKLFIILMDVRMRREHASQGLAFTAQ